MRKESKIGVIVKYRKLAEYSFTVTEKSPKKFRHTIVSRLQDGTLMALGHLIRVNDVMSLLDIGEFLENPNNIDIVRKHHKLWLESTNILNEIMNQSVFIDCESLLYNIEESGMEFVATACYIECLDSL